MADGFANAANASQGSISDIGLSLSSRRRLSQPRWDCPSRYARPARASCKERTAGSDAGTSLRVRSHPPDSPTKKQREVMKLSRDIRDAQGNFRPDVFAQFGRGDGESRTCLRGMLPAALIFGTDRSEQCPSVPEGAAGLRLMQFEIDQQGTAAEVAAARTTGLAGAFANLQIKRPTTGISVGTILAPALQEVAGVAAVASQRCGCFRTGTETSCRQD